jgi:uncharacterized membrane protein YgdD (TMEM256/DUF423 family)
MAVALGAIGAHALKARLAPTGADSMWATGVLYQMIHAVVLLVLSSRPRVATGPAICFLLGILLFSFNLYAFALWRPDVLMRIVPFGGVSFLVGWLWLAFRREW